VTATRKTSWPKKPLVWVDAGVLYISVSFTWQLPEVRRWLLEGDLFRRYDPPVVRIGGPAVDLMPEFLPRPRNVFVGGWLPGVLQRANPLATRTTRGCPRHCAFCGIGRGKIEPGPFEELEDYPVLPIVCDNNFLAASERHVDRVCRELREVWGWADFNQGLDARLLTPAKAEAIANIGKVQWRFAMDDMTPESRDAINEAGNQMVFLRVPYARVSAYALIGFADGPEEAWSRCRWLEGRGIRPYPMWYHALDALEYNTVTAAQEELGWTDAERKALMGWYYQHRRQGSLRQYRKSRQTPGQGALVG
jgi:hypothetical protein